ncbi:MAG TPA: hypothetical protein VFW48_10195 [Solirubrobacterales bacterium]|nr:hypothetical protein [Solirubrobacterales bacterium]
MATVIAASLAACGGDEPVTTTAPSADSTTIGETTADDTSSEQDDTSSEQIRSNVKTGPLRVTGGGTEQFRDIGFYTTLKHGKEANRRALEQAARVVHRYLIARVQYDWATACSYLDEGALKSVVSIGSQFEEITGEDCPAIISHLLGKVPPGKTLVSSEVEAGVLRIRREGGYFFYRAGGDPYTIGLSRDDDGNWKLSGFMISEITPPPS